MVVVAGALQQRLAEPLRDAAVYLPPRDQRVDQGPAIVDREEPVDGDVPGRDVDVDDRDVGPERERQSLGIVEDALVQPRFEPGRDVWDEVSQPGNIVPRHTAAWAVVRAFGGGHGEHAGVV